MPMPEPEYSASKRLATVALKEDAEADDLKISTSKIKN